MPYFTYDTSVIISRKIATLHEMPKNFRMSAIVLMELAGSAKDESRRKSYEQAFRQFEQNDLLIVPNADDWLLASRIIFLLTESRRRWKAQVVTENWADFKAIQRYCNATIIRAAQFFKN